MEFIYFIQTLESYGLTDALLPFLLIFTIIFAILQKSNIFGQDKKKYNVIVSLVIGLLVVIPHVMGRYPPGSDVVLIINSALPNVSLLVVAIVALLILIGIMGGNIHWAGAVSGGVAIVAVLAVAWIFLSAAGYDIWFNNWVLGWSPETTSVVVIVLIFAVLIWYITKEDAGHTGGKIKGMLEEVGNFFGGGGGHGGH